MMISVCFIYLLRKPLPTNCEPPYNAQHVSSDFRVQFIVRRFKKTAPKIKFPRPEVLRNSQRVLKTMSSSPTHRSSYEFGEFRIDRLDRVLMRDGELVPLTPKVFDLLLLLIENHGHVVGKERLMSEVWPDTFVEEGNLTQNISVLRKALGEKQYIQTIPRRGYRFVGDIRLAAEPHAELIIEEHSRAQIIIDESGNDSVGRVGAKGDRALINRRRGLSTARQKFLLSSAGLTVAILARSEERRV